MTVNEIKKAIVSASWKQVVDWTLLVDTLHGLKDTARGRKYARTGWKDRHTRRGAVLAALFRTYLPFDAQVEEARKLLKNYAGQIWKYDGKVPVKTREITFNESFGKWQT